MVGIVKVRRPEISGRRIGKKRMLKFLGLPLNARWDHAAPIIKTEIVRARKKGDDDAAAYWSSVKTALKRVLHSTCRFCGVVLCPQMKNCNFCTIHVIMPERRRKRVKPPIVESTVST